MPLTKEGQIWKEIKAIWSCNGATDEQVKQLKELIIEYKAQNLSLEEKNRKLERENLFRKQENIANTGRNRKFLTFPPPCSGEKLKIQHDTPDRHDFGFAQVD